MVSWISWSCAKHHFSLEQHLSLTFRKLFQLHFTGSSKFFFLCLQKYMYRRKFYFIKAQNYNIKSKIYNTTICCSKVLIYEWWIEHCWIVNSWADWWSCDIFSQDLLQLSMVDFVASAIIQQESSIQIWFNQTWQKIRNRCSHSQIYHHHW